MAKEIILDLDYKSDEIKDFEIALNNRIIGQEEAKKSIVESLERAMYPINDIKKTPIGVFLFIGPPGVGKTEVARGVANYLLGSDNAFTKIDCGQYKELHQRSRLLGSPPSYVGYSSVPILSDVNLFKHTKKAIKNKTINPIIQKHGEEFAIVLLDEFEKMHPELQDVFLAAFDEGHITLDNGKDEGNAVETKKNGIKFSKDVSFKNTIFIITSNAGSKDIVKMNSGKKTSLSFVEKNNDKLNTKKFYEEKLEKFLRPEFLSRVEQIIPFRELTHDEYYLKIEHIVRDYSLNLENMYGITFNLSKKAKDKILSVSISPEKGARLLNQNFNKYILGNISKIIGSGQLKDIKQEFFHIFVDVKGEEYVFKLKNINKLKNKNKDKNRTQKIIKNNNMNLMADIDYLSYIDYQVEEILPKLSALNLLYEYRDEIDEDYLISIEETENFLRGVGFTDLDFSTIKKTGLKSKFDDLNSYIYNYSGIELRKEFEHLNKYIAYIQKFVENKFKNNLENLDNNLTTIEQLIVEIEEFIAKILHKSLLNKEEINMVITFFHNEYIKEILKDDKAEVNLEIPNKNNNVNIKVFNNSSLNTEQKLLKYIKSRIDAGIDIADLIIDIETTLDNKKLTKEQMEQILKIFLELKTNKKD